MSPPTSEKELGHGWGWAIPKSSIALRTVFEKWEEKRTRNEF